MSSDDPVFEFDAEEILDQVRDEIEQRIRMLRCPVHQRTPRIVVSGHTADGDFRWSVEACCDALLGEVHAALGSDVSEAAPKDEDQSEVSSMPFCANVYQVLIASPSDVADERRLVQEIVFEWNAVHSRSRGIVLLPVMWETHAAPAMGDRPQGIINKQIVEMCDALIGIFWTRIGTHTGVAESGTVEEIEQFVGTKKPVLLYFSSKPVVPDNLDSKQFENLKAFRTKCQSDGLIERYESLSELRSKLTRQLAMVSQSFPGLRSDDGDTTPNSQLDQHRLARDLQDSIERSYVDWKTEKESDPYNLEDGKYILQALGNSLISHRVSLAGRISDEDLRQIEESIRKAKELQRHMLYMDGGKSFDAFWNAGDELYAGLRNVLSHLLE